MERREFLRKSCLAGAASLSGLAAGAEQDPMKRLPGESEAAYRTRMARARAAAVARRAEGEPDVSKRLPEESEAAYRTRMARARAQAAARARAVGGARDYYELRRFEIESRQQRAGFDRFAVEAAIPALNRLDVQPVGVFYPLDNDGLGPIYMLSRHKSLASVAFMTQRLIEDEEFGEAGSAFINAPADRPAYARMTSSLMVAFEGMKRLEALIGSLGKGYVVGGEGRNEITMQDQAFAQVHLYRSSGASIEGLERLKICPLNEFLFGGWCRSFGYSRLGGKTRSEELRMKMHIDLGAIPTLTVRSAEELENPNQAVEKILKLAGE